MELIQVRLDPYGRTCGTAAAGFLSSQSPTAAWKHQKKPSMSVNRL